MKLLNIGVYVLIGVLIGGAITAKKPNQVQADPTDLIIEKSKQTMQKAASVSQKADQVVVAQVKEMKQTIEVLEVERESLVQQVKVMYNEMESIKSAPVQSFDVLAILPDSASGGN